MTEFTHLDASGRAAMVDVGDKPSTQRMAEASGSVYLTPALLQKLMDNDLPKGDVLAVARIAGIQGAKQCSGLIPLCHQLPLSSVKIDFQFDSEKSRLIITSRCKTSGQTGVEMEALTAVSISALTIYDMCKGVDKGITIGDIRLLKKSGGASGDWQADR